MIIGLTFIIFFGVAFLMFASGKSWMAGVVHKAQEPELFWFTISSLSIILPFSANLQGKVSGFSPALQAFFQLGLALSFLLMSVTGFLYAGAAEMKGEVKWTFHKYARGDKYYDQTLSSWRMSNGICFLAGVGLLLFFLIGGRLTF